MQVWKTDMAIGDTMNKFWKQYNSAASFQKNIDSLMQKMVVTKIVSPGQSKLLCELKSDAFHWPGITIPSLKITQLEYSLLNMGRGKSDAPQELTLTIEIEGTPSLFRFDGFALDQYVHHYIFTGIVSSPPISMDLTTLEFIQKVRPNIGLALDWIKSTEKVKFEFQSLNFSNASYELVVYVDGIFVTKNFDLHVSRILFTKNDVQFIGSIHKLLLHEVAVTFFGSGAELVLLTHSGGDFSEIPSLRFNEDSFPPGVVPKGIFKTVPDLFQNSEIKMILFRSKLDLSDNLAIIFDRNYFVEFVLKDLIVNIIPELFPPFAEDFVCESAMSPGSITIEWGVFAPLLTVKSLSWRLNIHFRPERFINAPKTSLSFEFRSLYNSWVLYCKELFRVDTPMLLKHILENNMKYDFSFFTKNKTHKFDFASINIKHGHFELHERYDDYLVEFEYRSGWRGGSLEWKQNDPINKLTKIQRRHTNSKEIPVNRIILFEKDFRSKFIKILWTRCEKAHDCHFEFYGN